MNNQAYRAALVIAAANGFIATVALANGVEEVETRSYCGALRAARTLQSDHPTRRPVIWARSNDGERKRINVCLEAGDVPRALARPAKRVRVKIEEPKDAPVQIPGMSQPSYYSSKTARRAADRAGIERGTYAIKEFRDRIYVVKRESV